MNKFIILIIQLITNHNIIIDLKDLKNVFENKNI